MLRPALVIALLVAGSAGAAPLERLEYRDDRVTLRAHDAPLADVVDSLKRQSGAELRGTAPDGVVTAELDAVPLREALGRLLGEQSFTLTYGEGGRLKTIELKGGPVAKSPSTESASAHRGGGDAGKGPARWQAIATTFTDAGPVPVTGLLRQVAGSDKASWDFVLRMTGAKDPTVKSEAIRTGVRAVEEDADMRESLLGILRSMDDQELATFVRAMAGSINDDPESIMKAIARASRDAEVRSRAHDVVRQLRADQRAAAGST
jgi:hypothetical protein